MHLLLQPRRGYVSRHGLSVSLCCQCSIKRIYTLSHVCCVVPFITTGHNGLKECDCRDGLCWPSGPASSCVDKLEHGLRKRAHEPCPLTNENSDCELDSTPVQCSHQAMAAGKDILTL